MSEQRKSAPAPAPARVRLGMVGGGRDAFIGGVHRIASRIDDRYELLAGAFSSSADKARASARDLGVADDRAYGDFEAMAAAEAAREDGIEAVSIVTPNHVHFAASKAFLEHGIHVISDKPMTSTLDDALALAEVVKHSRARFFLTHNYTGYPMIRQAREMIASGALGTLRVVQVEYAQDWLSTRLEDSGQKQAGWRVDPAKSGAGGSVGDIGTHAFNLAGFVTGLRCREVLSDIDSFVDGRQLDDNCHVLLRYEQGAKGMLWCSQVAPGNENALTLRVYGSEGGLSWEQENPNRLWHTPLGEPTRLITRGGGAAGDAANAVTRIPGGHPEGYLEGFANLYTDVAGVIVALRTGDAVPDSLCPGVEDGVAGLRFIDAVVHSSAQGGRWTALS